MEDKGKIIIEVPCWIGDVVYVLRDYCGRITPSRGIVREIVFSETHEEPLIIVRGIGRGCWGTKIFATREDAARYAQERAKQRTGGGSYGAKIQL